MIRGFYTSQAGLKELDFKGTGIMRSRRDVGGGDSGGVGARVADPIWEPVKLRVWLEREAPEIRWPACLYRIRSDNNGILFAASEGSRGCRCDGSSWASGRSEPKARSLPPPALQRPDRRVPLSINPGSRSRVGTRKPGKSGPASSRLNPKDLRSRTPPKHAEEQNPPPLLGGSDSADCFGASPSD